MLLYAIGVDDIHKHESKFYLIIFVNYKNYKMQEMGGTEMRMQERRLPLGYIWLMVTMLVIGTGVFSYTYRVNQVMRNFHHRAYEDEKDPRKQDSFRRFLTSIGANLTVPATGGETLTFTSPVTFTVYERFNTETKIRRGDTVSCDFITWSGEGGDSVRF